MVSIRPILSFPQPTPDHQSFLKVPHLYSDSNSRSQSVEPSAARVDRIARPGGKRSLEIAKKRKKQEDRVMSDPEDAAQVARSFNDLVCASLIRLQSF